MVLLLPFPPSVNGYWRSYHGRQIMCKKGREYRDNVRRQLSGCGAFYGRDRLSVTIALSPPDRRRRDIDNYSKALLDALTHAGVWADDSQIDDLRIVRMATHEGTARVRIDKIIDANT
jgi:crossover junction endodeoxyribonuclease RusA